MLRIACGWIIISTGDTAAWAMYDRQTESLWQQISGDAVVGDMVDLQLKRLPAQIISFEQFRSAYKDGLVLSREIKVRP